MLLCFCLGSVVACNEKDAQAVNNSTGKEDIKNTFEKIYPEAKVAQVRETSMPGVFEVVVGQEILYTDVGVKYMIVGGSLVDTKAKVNLTAKRLQELNTVAFSSLPLNKAIKQVKGKGERKLVVFSDPDCRFCKMLEQSLAKIDNVTIYTFLFPLTSLHPGAEKKARQIWCSNNPLQSWQALMIDGKEPSGADSCANPIKDVIVLGEKLGVSATPALIFGNGEMLTGALNEQQLEDKLNEVAMRLKQK